MNVSSIAPAEDFGRLRLVARISLWFGGLAVIALLALVLIAAPTPSDYVGAIARLSATREQLPLLMGLGGLLLAIGTALTTWLIATYGSFRVAGPLHRFCIDLEQGVRGGQVPRIRVRQTDHIQDEARYLEDSVSELYRRYDEIGSALARADEALRAHGRIGSVALSELEKARELAAEFRL